MFLYNALAETSLSCPEGIIYISGGNFRMGSDRQDFLEEKAVDDVTVDSFCIDRIVGWADVRKPNKE